MATLDWKRCICQSSESEKLTQVGKRIKTLIEFSEVINDNILHSYLVQAQKEGGLIQIHGKWQKDATNKLHKKRRCTAEGESSGSTVPKLATRSSNLELSWKTTCFMCCADCKKDDKHLYRNKVFEMRTLPFKQRVLDICEKRSDKWRHEV